MTIFRTIITLWPLRFFTYSGLLILLAGMILDLRYLFLFWLYQATGHIQSLLLGAILVIVGILVMIMGWLADLINRNRMISEEILYFLRKRKYEEESKK